MGRPSGLVEGFAGAKDDVEVASPADGLSGAPDFWQAMEKAANNSAPTSDANLFLFTISIFSWSLLLRGN
jgi:hypothetical protein